MKRQRIVHCYGEDDVDDEELEEELHQRLKDKAVPHHLPETSDSMPNGVDFVVPGKCKCGSTSHKRTSHHDCPL